MLGHLGARFVSAGDADLRKCSFPRLSAAGIHMTGGSWKPPVACAARIHVTDRWKLETSCHLCRPIVLLVKVTASFCVIHWKVFSLIWG